MAEQDVFNKIHVDERDKADLGGVLDQLNLPPVFIEFVRRNQRTIYIVLGLLAIAVVTWALYGSYVENRLAESSNALMAAEKLEGADKVAALEKVATGFSGTDSALWARVGLARHSIENQEYQKALLQYTEIRDSLKKSSPMYPLVTFGIAQAQEFLDNFPAALQEYALLKNTPGYENMGYSGTARLHERQGNIEAAVNEYEQYLAILDESRSSAPEKAFIDEKLNRLMAEL
ncbi:MAG: tetratricopeptide repeat protein [Desulfopila sp.]|jgi:predicted negative regulator of RcsB-dependent stress response|nr:tetratricopeptide repeat protein [Desulfopila sp.]